MRYRDLQNGKPYEATEEKETEEHSDPIVESLKEKINKYNFLQEVFSQPPPQLSPSLPQQQYQAPELIDPYAEFLKDVPQYQQGGVIEDNLGYLNPNNIGKIVKINSPHISMKGVDRNLIGLSENTGETKLMVPNMEYYFNNTNSVIEYPI